MKLNDLNSNVCYQLEDGSIVRYQFHCMVKDSHLIFFRPMKLNSLFEFTNDGYIVFPVEIVDYITEGIYIDPDTFSDETIESANYNELLGMGCKEIENKQKDNIKELLSGVDVLVKEVIELRTELNKLKSRQ